MDFSSIITRANTICEARGIDRRIYTKSGAGKDFVSNINKGSAPSIEKVYALATYLDCSVDYLLGRTDNPQSHKGGVPAVALGDISNNNGVIGGIANNAPVTIKSGETEPPNIQEVALLEAFRQLDEMTKAKVLIYTGELCDNK